ncbi:hypothetical protein DSO57_1034064 [Entomophthora muscae]|uniref:Uncharacterized protein n=1 Tax=Entomophthora muscae TaxID=34485 RepID=A0ACC2T051_9FUNG|nr:hypothetical protein DSO57_1034064 [Entomophthora muscae]
MKFFVPLTLLAAATARGPQETQLMQICNSTHVQVVHLKITSSKTDRLLEDVCASSLCHLSMPEREACKDKKVVLDLEQNYKFSGDYQDYHALEIFRNNMKPSESSTGYAPLDGISIKITDPAKMTKFFAKMSELMKPWNDQADASSKDPKPYLAIAVDETIKWSDIQGFLPIVSHVIYLASEAPECTPESDHVLCKLIADNSVPYMIDINKYLEDDKYLVYDFDQFKKNFKVGPEISSDTKFEAFIGISSDFGIKADAPKVLSIHE